MNQPTLHIEQDVIDTLSVVGREFLEQVLAMNWDECLLTDLSSLSDFTGSGNTPQALNDLAKAGARRDYCRAWDQWVLDRIEQLYAVRPASTTSPLVQLLTQIEKSRQPATIH